ncbi:MAG: hypothetical protein IPG93_22970 [Burkholderiales bacterium]|nr:hypothetical protein [Burkholderiales bacterium]
MNTKPTDAPRLLRGSRNEANHLWVAAWETLVDKQPHLRHPEAAAAALRIPEAGLMAVRNGDDTTRLRGRLDEWLAPLPGWGRVAITVRNRLGSATMCCEVRSVKLTGDTLSLRGDQGQVLISVHAANHGFLYEDRTSARQGHSLHVYDPAGEALMRLHFLGDAGVHEALPHLMAHANVESGHSWRAGSIGVDAVKGFPGWCSIVSTLNRMDSARRAMVAAAASCTAVAQMRLLVEGKAVALSYTGPVLGSLQPSPPDPEPQIDCLFSARATTANHAFVCLSPEQVPYLRFHDTEGGSVTLWPQLNAAAARAWVDVAINPTKG